MKRSPAGRLLVTIATVCAMVSCICAEYFTNKWAVHIEGGEDVARRLAKQHGFAYLDKIMPDFYHFQHRKVSRRSLDPTNHIHTSLSQEPEVKWLEQQISKKRVKRDADTNLFNDPKWPRMWYLHRDGGLDMNVVDVYKRWGITGRGTVVSILDDGIEKDHPDLKNNYDAGASYDVNGHDDDPQPRYDYTNENRHGTRCAGEVAAEANNGICSTGVAYEAGIGGVRMLDGDVTDAVEAQSISLNPQHIDIYSASWGPDDDGRTVDGPGPLARKAFFDGIVLGRKGLGSIYVWASGNGGRNGDSCNCDGYTNSIYTLSISSASENGLVPWYSEACASTLATTYSSGGMSERQILTTDLRQSCTEQHTGTSASAPLAAGICALALQANPDLTWRDMQYIVVLTARQANLNADDWVVNGIGRRVSHHYGFGLMDATAMVELAMNWTRVPDQHRCQVNSHQSSRDLEANSAADMTLDTDGCASSSDVIKFLEHVQVAVTLSAARRGEVQIMLTSPRGTQSVVLARRSVDMSGEGLSNWVLMTTHCWGEQPAGTWTLSVRTGQTTAKLTSWSLILFGTAEPPVQLAQYVSSHAPSTATPSTTLLSTTYVPSTTVLPSSVVTSNARGVSSSSSTVNVASSTVSSSSFSTGSFNTADSHSHCSPGTYLLEGQCYSYCPILYYPANMTSSQSSVGADASNPVLHSDIGPSAVSVCLRCTSFSMCPGVLRSLLIAVVGTALLVCIIVLALCAVPRCQRRHRGIGRHGADLDAASLPLSARFRTPRYHINGHIIIGVHNKPLLGSESYSSEEDEDDVQTVVLNVAEQKH